MILTFNLEDQGHILFPRIDDYVGAHVKSNSLGSFLSIVCKIPFAIVLLPYDLDL